MANLNEVYEMLSKLPPEEFELLKSFLTKSPNYNKEEVLTNIRFSAGRVCPHCNKTNVVRNGHRPSDKMQKYFCKDCHKSFVITTNTLMSNSHKDYRVWNDYINCMLQKKSLWKSARFVHISYSTSFTGGIKSVML